MSDMLRQMLLHHEDMKLKPYHCKAGKLTIGVGRNIEDNGITEAEAMMLLENDMRQVYLQLGTALPWYKLLDNVRRDVLADMCFNMGLPTFMEFKKTLHYVETGQYHAASIEMLHSKWADQVSSRARRLSHMMNTGEEFSQS